MEEVYTGEELAAIMAVPCQTVWAWKRSGQIPSKAITPEGTFIKAIIDPMIEVYKNATPPAPPADTEREENSQTPPQTQPKKRTMPKKTKGYSKKVRQEANRLFEQNTPLTQVARQIGCSVECARQWRKKYQESSAAPSEANISSPSASVPPKTKTEAVSGAKKKSAVDFDEFVRGYWQEGTRAVDVLLLPPEIGPKITQYVNEALKYAYERLR